MSLKEEVTSLGENEYRLFPPLPPNAGYMPPGATVTRITIVRYLDINKKFGITSEGLLVKLTPLPERNAQEIPFDEPIFVMRARDRLALATLNNYYALSIADGATPFHLEAVAACFKQFAEFRNSHPERMKQPGITLGKI